MALTQHQQEKLNQSLSFLEEGNRLLIRGSAGVGKTFMVNELIKALRESYIRGEQKIYCSAPTNKAVAVLKGKVDAHKSVDFITTHAALKLKRNIDYKTGEISFKPAFDPKYPPLKGVRIFIIDESSMVNIELLNYIEEHALKNNCRVVFIGDDKQLNPVNEEDSPVFLKGYPEVELTEVVRQKGGNPIIDLSRDLQMIKSGEGVRNDVGGYIYTYDKDRVIETLAKVNGTDDLKYLAYTNVEVDNINKLVRQRIYGTPAKIEVGETLVFNAPLGELYFTNEEILVEKVRICEKPFKFMVRRNPGSNDDYEEIVLKYYSINYKTIQADGIFNLKDSVIDTIVVIHEDSEKDYNTVCGLLKNRAKLADIPWTEYYSFIEQFADLKYNHAITVHKSQGSTYKQAIVNIKNININQNEKEKKRLLYTAITRASDLLILYNV